MSLERYLQRRLVVLRPNSTAYEAARAMADNHVGAILVARDQALVGVATDRDLALDVIGADLEPGETTLHDVMSDEIAMVGPNASVEDVIELMKEHGCRRVPIVEDGKPVGIVTLDDLLLEGEIDLEATREILRAQLEVAASSKPAGVAHPVERARPRTPRGERARHRSRARAEATFGRMLNTVQERTGLTGRQQAEQALLVVVGGLCQRVIPEVARHFVAQLPARLKSELDGYFIGPDKGITGEVLLAQLSDQLGLDEDRAESVLSGVLSVVSESVSAGEIQDLRQSLPGELRELIPAPRLRKTG